LKSLASTDSSFSHEQIVKNISKIVFKDKIPDEEKLADNLYSIGESKDLIEENQKTFQLDYSINNNDDEAFSIGEFSQEIEENLSKKIISDFSYKKNEKY